MANFTKPENLINQAQQSLGPFNEGNEQHGITLRVFQPDRGLDVEYFNRNSSEAANNSSRSCSIEESQAEPPSDGNRDKRLTLGTQTFNDRGMWENINYNESSLQPYISDENPKSLTPSTLPTTIIDTDDGTIFDIKSQKPAFTSTQLDYSVDAIPFVLNPDNNNEIVRVDRYYDKEIDPINYNLATEGKINYYLFLLESGRLLDEEVMTNIDLYQIRNPKPPTNNGFPSNFAKQKDSDDKDIPDRGFYIFNLNWGDGSESEFTDKPKLLEATTLLEHLYKKPGFYSITGVIYQYVAPNRGIKQYERFQTNILLNPSEDYEINLFNYNNFATIGGISPNSSLVKSAYNLVGIDPKDPAYVSKSSLNKIQNLNLLDKLQLFNFFTKVRNNNLEQFNEIIIPYSQEIDDTLLAIFPLDVYGCNTIGADNYGLLSDGTPFIDEVTSEQINILPSETLVNAGCVFTFIINLGINNEAFAGNVIARRGNINVIQGGDIDDRLENTTSLHYDLTTNIGEDYPQISHTEFTQTLATQTIDTSKFVLLEADDPDNGDFAFWSMPEDGSVRWAKVMQIAGERAILGSNGFGTLESDLTSPLILIQLIESPSGTNYEDKTITAVWGQELDVPDYDHHVEITFVSNPPNGGTIQGPDQILPLTQYTEMPSGVSTRGERTAQFNAVGSVGTLQSWSWTGTTYPTQQNPNGTEITNIDRIAGEALSQFVTGTLWKYESDGQFILSVLNPSREIGQEIIGRVIFLDVDGGASFEIEDFSDGQLTLTGDTSGIEVGFTPFSIDSDVLNLRFFETGAYTITANWLMPPPPPWAGGLFYFSAYNEQGVPFTITVNKVNPQNPNVIIETKTVFYDGTASTNEQNEGFSSDGQPWQDEFSVLEVGEVYQIDISYNELEYEFLNNVVWTGYNGNNSGWLSWTQMGGDVNSQSPILTIPDLLTDVGQFERVATITPGLFVERNLTPDFVNGIITKGEDSSEWQYVTDSANDESLLVNIIPNTSILLSLTNESNDNLLNQYDDESLTELLDLINDEASGGVYSAGEGPLGSTITNSPSEEDNLIRLNLTDEQESIFNQLPSGVQFYFNVDLAFVEEETEQPEQIIVGEARKFNSPSVDVLALTNVIENQYLQPAIEVGMVIELYYGGSTGQFIISDFNFSGDQYYDSISIQKMPEPYVPPLDETNPWRSATFDPGAQLSNETFSFSINLSDGIYDPTQTTTETEPEPNLLFGTVEKRPQANDRLRIIRLEATLLDPAPSSDAIVAGMNITLSTTEFSETLVVTDTQPNDFLFNVIGQNGTLEGSNFIDVPAGTVLDYEIDLNEEVGSVPILGCTDNTADNYNFFANIDDGSCVYTSTINTGDVVATVERGGLFGLPNNTENQVQFENGQSETYLSSGTDINMIATVQEEDPIHEYSFENWEFAVPIMAEYAEIINPNDRTATLRYINPTDETQEVAVIGIYSRTDRIIRGCTTPGDANYDPNATVHNEGACAGDAGDIVGCTNDRATNFNPLANADDGSCIIEGCMDPGADNFDEEATQQPIDIPGQPPVCIYRGCTDSGALNYDPNANQDDGNCRYLADPSSRQSPNSQPAGPVPDLPGP